MNLIRKVVNKVMGKDKKFVPEPFIVKLRGYVDSVADSEGYNKRRDDMNRWLKEYAGEWWNAEQQKTWDSKLFINYIFSTVETNSPLLTDNRPIWYVRAREPYLQRYATLYQKGLDYLWDKLDMDRKTYMAVKTSQLQHVGLLKVWFDPDSEDGLGECRVDIVDPRTFFIFPGYDDAWDCAGCGERRRMPMSWVRGFFPEQFSCVQPDEADGEKDFSRYEDFELENKQVTVYEVWLKDRSIEEYIEEVEKDDTGEKGEKKKSRPKYPNGRVVCFTKNRVILYDKPSPYKHGKSPYIPFYDYPMLHDFWGIPEPQQIEQLNREINLRLQQMVHHSKMHAKPNYVVDAGSGLDIEQIKKLMPEGDNVFAANNMSAVPEPIRLVPTPPVHPIHKELIAGLASSIEEVSGVTDISKGMATKKQRQSASEVSILIESSYTRTRQRVRNVEWSLRRVAYLILELMQQYYTEVRSFSYRQGGDVVWGNVSNSKKFAEETFKPQPPDPNQPPEEVPEEAQQIKQEEQDFKALMEKFGEADEIYIPLDIEVQTNSTLPMDRQSLANLFIQLAQTQITPASPIDREALLKQLRIPNADEISARMNQKEAMMAAAQAGAQPPMGGPAPIPGPGGQPMGAAPGQLEGMSG